MATQPQAENPMMEIDAVIHGWRTAGVPLNGPASHGELARLAEFLGVPLPQDLRALYSAVNGMEENVSDDWNASFWSIDRVIRERDTLERADGRWVAFADFLIYSWCFRIMPQGDQTAIFVDGTRETFESLGQFFDRYARDPDSLALIKGS